MATAKVSKASIIREFLGKYPEKGPTELLEIIKKGHPTMKLTPAEISVQKHNLKSVVTGNATEATVRQVNPVAAPATTGGMIKVQNLQTLKALVGEMGVEGIQSALEILK